MPLAILLCGPSLAGKSTAAQAIRETLGGTVISADEINAQRGLPFGADGLPESVWAETLRMQIAQLHACGESGSNAIIDDTLCYRWLRDILRNEAADVGLSPILLQFSVSNVQILDRWKQLVLSAKRPILSEARLSQHLATFEWPTPDEHALEIMPDADVVQVLQAHLQSTGSAA